MWRDYKMSKPRFLDPRVGCIFLDSNALDYDETLSSRLLDLAESEKIKLQIPKRVLDEIRSIRTPKRIRAAMLDQIFTEPVALTIDEEDKLKIARGLLRGNALSDKHDADADHIFEAVKYGARYFITHDNRILKNQDNFRKMFGTQIAFVDLPEFITIYDDFSNRGFH
jgi:predicted nucleic acid-binding protein